MSPKTKPSAERIIRTPEQLQATRLDWRNCTFIGMDLKASTIDWSAAQIENTVFLGCELPKDSIADLSCRGAVIFSAPDHLPYQPFRQTLYHWKELAAPTEQAEVSVDLNIYEHFAGSRYNPSVQEALWQRIHDHGIDQALRDLLVFDEQGMTDQKCIGIMGGHGTPRTDPYYRKTVETAYLLAKSGFFIASGGGPGIMEAANLGAYLSTYPESSIATAIELMAESPTYKDAGYMETAVAVLEKFPAGAESLAIPTWFYGHEPSNVFASHIAKYFSNSIREDNLLAISLYGVVFAPGSAGTTQEIFMDAAQNHYATFNHYSPMVFLGEKRYEIDTLIFPLLKQLAHGKTYSKGLFLTDKPAAVRDFILEHPPITA